MSLTKVTVKHSAKPLSFFLVQRFPPADDGSLSLADSVGAEAYSLSSSPHQLKVNTQTKEEIYLIHFRIERNSRMNVVNPLSYCKMVLTYCPWNQGTILYLMSIFHCLRI